MRSGRSRYRKIRQSEVLFSLIPIYGGFLYHQTREFYSRRLEGSRHREFCIFVVGSIRQVA